MGDVRVRRIYDDAAASDGQRVLVDRLWPRGVRKAAAALDRHLPDVAPSSELRRWYGHRPERYEEFVARYQQELEDRRTSTAVAELLAAARTGRVTLLTATKDVERSHARVLARWLRDELGQPAG